MSWLRLGPLAVRVEGPADLWPWPWPLHRAPHPGGAVGAAAAAAGRRGGRARGAAAVVRGLYEGPGFWLRAGAEGHEAGVASPVASMGALAAALIDRGQEVGFGVAHGALLAVCDRGALLLGPSGAGKSTTAARHRAHALGSNAALIWADGAHFRAHPLPLTGHGDAATRPEGARLVGGLWLGEERRPAAGRVTLRWLGALAAALGRPPPLDLALALARGLPLRGYRG